MSDPKERKEQNHEQNHGIKKWSFAKAMKIVEPSIDDLLAEAKELEEEEDDEDTES